VDGNSTEGRTSRASGLGHTVEDSVGGASANSNSSETSHDTPGTAPATFLHPQAFSELTAACASAIRGLAHAALGLPGGGLSRLSPHELCSLLQAVADLHAAPSHAAAFASDNNEVSSDGGKSKAGEGSSAASSIASSSSPRSSTLPKTTSNPRSPPLRPPPSLPSPRSNLSPPNIPLRQTSPQRHQPGAPPPSASPTPFHTNKRTQHDAHHHLPPDVSAFLQRLFDAALCSVATRMASFTVEDCCELLHACAVLEQVEQGKS
jgi:hypothetical protein